MTDILNLMADTLRDAKKQRIQLAKNIDILQRLGENIGTMLTDLHNIDVKIAKQEKVLNEEGIKL